MEGRMKLSISVNQSLNKFLLYNKSVRDSVFFSLKHGLIPFITLLLSLGLFEYMQCLVHSKPIKIIDTIDLAISFLGFLLVFAGKLLEKLYGKV